MKYAWYLFLSRFAWWTRKPPAIGGKLLTGYGRVNWWSSGGQKTLREDLCRCAAAGVAFYSIEMAGWAETTAYRKAFGSAARMRAVGECYALAVKLCRTFGMWLHVSIVNDNMGLKKYGDPGIFLQQVMDEAQGLCRVVKSHGPQNVIVQPVAETQTSAGVAFTAYCVRELRGFKLCNNNRSKPTSGEGMPYFAWHPFSIGEIAGAPKDALIVSDTGRIILELGQGYDGPGNPAKLKQYVNACRVRGCPAAIYYAFKRKDHDKGAIEAMGV